MIRDIPSTLGILRVFSYPLHFLTTPGTSLLRGPRLTGRLIWGAPYSPAACLGRAVCLWFTRLHFLLTEKAACLLHQQRDLSDNSTQTWTSLALRTSVKKSVMHLSEWFFFSFILQSPLACWLGKKRLWMIAGPAWVAGTQVKAWRCLPGCWLLMGTGGPVHSSSDTTVTLPPSPPAAPSPSVPSPCTQFVLGCESKQYLRWQPLLFQWSLLPRQETTAWSLCRQGLHWQDGLSHVSLLEGNRFFEKKKKKKNFFF
jgi:hypothetical protein